MYSLMAAISHPTVTDVNICCVHNAVGDSTTVNSCMCDIAAHGSGLETLLAICMAKQRARVLLYNPQNMYF